MCFDSKLEREKKFVVCLMFYLMDIFKWAYLSIFFKYYGFMLLDK